MCGRGAFYLELLVKIGNWKKTRETVETTGYRDLFGRYFELPDGREKGYDIVGGNHGVSILPITVGREVVLVRQFRPGPERVLLEMPSGGVDPGELWVDAAERELLEETGYLGDLRYITTTYIGAYAVGWRHVFAATNCEKIQEPELDENEFLETVLMPLEAFRSELPSWEAADVGAAYQALDVLGEL